MKEILIIEDNKINCMLYEKIINDSARNIDFAYDGQEGIDKFKEKLYDLILLDLGLPKIHGLEVAKMIREHENTQQITANTPIIVITANNFPGTEQLALEAGANEYLTKPFDIKQLRHLVNTYLHKEADKQA